MNKMLKKKHKKHKTEIFLQSIADGSKQYKCYRLCVGGRSSVVATVNIRIFYGHKTFLKSHYPHLISFHLTPFHSIEISKNQMKENANPTIYSVKDTSQIRNKDFYNKLIASEALSRFSFDPKNVNTFDISSIPTPMERSIHMTLNGIEKGEHKDYDPLSLLRQSGMLPITDGDEEGIINTRKNNNMIHRSIFEKNQFIPSKENDLKKSNENNIASPTKLKRDIVEPEEIFDIIRNIQDPEHPLTLEQLNVVNLNHISVNDIASSEVDDGDDFSSIDVKFT